MLRSALLCSVVLCSALLCPALLYARALYYKSLRFSAFRVTCHLHGRPGPPRARSRSLPSRPTTRPRTHSCTRILARTSASCSLARCVPRGSESRRDTTWGRPACGALEADGSPVLARAPASSGAVADNGSTSQHRRGEVEGGRGRCSGSRSSRGSTTSIQYASLCLSMNW